MSRRPRERRQRPSGKTRTGDHALRRALVRAAEAAGRARRTYLGAQYRRLAARRGKQRAAVAVAHTSLVIAYQLLARRTSYTDLGPESFDPRNTEALERQLVKRLEGPGNKVTIEKVA